MYSVKITNDSTSTIIHDDRHSKFRLDDTKIATTVNQASSFAFNIYPNNPGYNLLHEYTTGIEIYKNTRLLFKGRVMTVYPNYTNDGQLYKQVTCESQMAFLNDSIQMYKKVQMTPKKFFTFLIDQHNSQVDAGRRFKVGKVNVTNSTNNVYCYIEDGITTFDEIDTDLLQNSSLGGELWVRNETDGVYIDWLQDNQNKGNQQIKLNKNMLSIFSKPNLTGLVTVLCPFGATQENKNGSVEDEVSDVASPRLTIKSVNDGKVYLKDTELIGKYGRISGSKIWDDVKVATNLKTKGLAYLNTFKSVKIGHEIEAVDLEPLGLAIDDFEVGKYYRVINPLVGIDDYLRIIAITVDINAPLQSSLTIADKSISLTNYQLENKKAAKTISQLRSIVESQGNQIIDLNGQTEKLNKTIEDQKKVMDQLQEDVQNADIKGISKKLQDLLKITTELGEQVDELQFVTPEQLAEYQSVQKQITDDLDQRIKLLEQKGGDINNGGKG